ncbi:splicing factor [Dispira simplex]|nr:splicing factor [Dispira simplex]
MADYARNLINELMSPYQNKKTRNFWDSDVCKNFLVGFCPRDLFTNTKAFLGTCDKIHDEALRRQYQEAPDRHRYSYERDFMMYLRDLCHDLDRRIGQRKERLLNEPGDVLSNPKKDEMEEKIVMLEVNIKSLLTDAETAGEEGRVQEAQDLSNQAERCKRDLEVLRAKVSSNPIAKQDRRMEVCAVCGGFLVTGDDTSRLEAHNDGRQHRGYDRIRKTYQDLRKKYDISPRHDSRRRYDRRGEGSDRRRSRHSRSRSRDYRRGASKDRERRSRDRSHRHTSRRSRSPGNHRQADRSHSSHRTREPSLSAEPSDPELELGERRD